MKRPCIYTSFMIFLLLTGCTINRSIRVEDGYATYGSKNTVNGRISIGADADVSGACRTVNGRIVVGNRSSVRTLESVNGRIKIGREVHINGDVQTVNGKITTEPGTRIAGDINTVNGRIELEGTLVDNNITTYNGNIVLNSHTIVSGHIIIKNTYNVSHDYRHVSIDITDGSIVEGDIIVDSGDIDVTVYLSHGGKINGSINGAHVIEH